MAKLLFDSQYFLFDSVANAEAATPSVSADASVTPGATLGYTVSNFAGAITTATLTDSKGNVLTLTSVTDTGAAVPALGDEQQYCLLEGVTLTVSDGTDTATDTLTFVPASGFAEVQLEAGFVTNETSFLYNYGGTPAVDDQFIEGEADLVLFSDGTFDASTDGHYTIYAIDATDGWMQSFVLDVVDIGGEASHQAATATSSGSGTVADVVGQGSMQATRATQVANGSVGRKTGAGSHQATRATHTATGVRAVTGESAHRARRATQDAEGAVNSQPITGTAAHQASTATHTGLGGYLLDTPVTNTTVVDISTKYSVKAA